MTIVDFPVGAVDKESSSQLRGHEFDPQSRKIPHV